MEGEARGGFLSLRATSWLFKVFTAAARRPPASRGLGAPEAVGNKLGFNKRGETPGLRGITFDTVVAARLFHAGISVSGIPQGPSQDCKIPKLTSGVKAISCATHARMLAREHTRIHTHTGTLELSAAHIRGLPVPRSRNCAFSLCPPASWSPFS